MNADESQRLYAGVELRRIGKRASGAQCVAPRPWRVKIDCFGEGSSGGQPAARKAIPFRVHRTGRLKQSVASLEKRMTIKPFTRVRCRFACK